MRLPYLKSFDVTPCSITLYKGIGEDGGPVGAGSWSWLVNFSEKVRRVQDKNGQWVALTGVIRVKGDILPGAVFDDGVASIGGHEAKRIVHYSRPRNPDGTVNHTRIELA